MRTFWTVANQQNIAKKTSHTEYFNIIHYNIHATLHTHTLTHDYFHFVNHNDYCYYFSWVGFVFILFSVLFENTGLLCVCFFSAQLDSFEHEATFCCCRLFLWALLSATLTIFNASHKSHMSAIFACSCVPLCANVCLCVYD